MEKKNTDIIREGGLAVLKSIIGNFPLIGGLLNEALFEIRGRIKQERINNFITNLSEYLSGRDDFIFDQNHLRSEAFSDLFENVLQKISKTRSTIKTKLFRQLLLKQFTAAQSIDQAELLIELIDQLNEKQVFILDGLHNAFGSGYNALQLQILDIRREIQILGRELKKANLDMNREFWEQQQVRHKQAELTKQIEKLRTESAQLATPYQAETYALDWPTFFYLVHDLNNKGLILDIGTKSGAEPLSIIEITQMGIDIVDFLKEER